jgi:hypothetical protein
MSLSADGEREIFASTANRARFSPRASSSRRSAIVKADRLLDDSFYRKLVTEYLEKFGSASRADIDELLLDKLSDALDEQQKATKIGNLLTVMRKAGEIENTGPRKTPRWQLIQKNKKE